MTIWHLVAVAGLILIGAATALRLLTGDDTDTDTDQTTVLPALWDDTDVIPVWVDGWGANGWCPLAELTRIEREYAALGLADDGSWRAWLDGHREIADEAWARHVTADLDGSPILAGLVAYIPVIETRKPLELTGASA